MYCGMPEASSIFTQYLSSYTDNRYIFPARFLKFKSYLRCTTKWMDIINDILGYKVYTVEYSRCTHFSAISYILLSVIVKIYKNFVFQNNLRLTSKAIPPRNVWGLFLGWFLPWQLTSTLGSVKIFGFLSLLVKFQFIQDFSNIKVK